MSSRLRAVARSIPIGPRPEITGVRPGFEKQENFKWCWAACVEMILKHHQVSTDTQCEVAQKGLKLIGKNLACCTSGKTFNNNVDCVELLPDDKITLLWGDYHDDLSVDHANGRITDQKLQDELNSGNYVEIGYEQSTSGHVVLVYGWTNDTPDNELFFLLHDPKSNPDAMLHTSIIGDNGRGTWNATCKIKKL